MNEKQLLDDIKADPQQFGQLYDAFHQKIFGYVYRRTVDYDAASDITAETFLKAFLSIDRFKRRDISLLYWLYRIATNELNKYFNARKYSPKSLERIQEEYDLDIIDHSSHTTERARLQEELERHEEFMKMTGAIKKLDTKYGDVIALRFFEHKSVSEIAAILDKKEGTVKSLLSRGIEKLRESLKDEHEKR